MALPVHVQALVIKYSVNMADEIEIKLKASEQQALNAVRKLRWLKAMMQSKARRKDLRSVYFDTTKGKLQKNGLTLRVRHEGKRRLQTVKAERKGMFTRHEWECEITGDKPDLSALPPEARKRFGKLGPLRPVFETTVARTTILLRCSGAELELALDSGVIKAGRRRASICEIEIELKRGDPAALATLAERLAGEIDVSFEVRAKSERGYALAVGELGCVVPARGVNLDVTMTVAEAFRAIAMGCLRHLSSNETAVLGGDAGGVLQMHAGLRRLRAAMSVFRVILSDSQSQNIRAELKWLTEQFRPAPDFDAFARVRKAVEDERYRRLVLAVALWLANGAWASRKDLTQRARCDRPIFQFVAETLDACTDKANEKARKFKTLTPRACRQLLATIKTLHYAVEFFAPLYDGRKAKRRCENMSASLTVLHKALGHLNNFSVQQKMATGIVAAAEHSCFLTVARKASDRIRVQKPFWA